MAQKVKKRFPKVFTAIYVFATVIMVGFLVLPYLNLSASTAASFTVTQTGTTTYANASATGLQAMVVDLPTPITDTTVTDHADATPTAGYDFSVVSWASTYYADSNSDNAYNDGEAIVSSSDATLDSADTVITTGLADLSAFATNTFVIDGGGASDNNLYDDGEAIIVDNDGTIDAGLLNSGNTKVITSGTADLDEDLTGGLGGLRYNDEDAGNTWTTGEDIFTDDDGDGVWTSQADSAADCDGSSTTTIGTCSAMNAGDSIVALAGTENLCTDSLTAPTVVYVDGDGDCTSGSGGTDSTLRDDGNGIGTATISVGTFWSFVDDGVVNGTWDDGEDLIYNGADPQGIPDTTYSTAADTMIYNGGDGNDTMSHADSLSVFVDADNIMYLDSNHDASYSLTPAPEPLILTSADTAPGGDLVGADELLAYVSGAWTNFDITDLSTLTTTLYCDNSNTNVYVDGEAIIDSADSNLTAGALDGSGTDTVKTAGFCDLTNTWASENLVHTNNGAYDNTADIISDNDASGYYNADQITTIKIGNPGTALDADFAGWYIYEDDGDDTFGASDTLIGSNTSGTYISQDITLNTNCGGSCAVSTVYTSGVNAQTLIFVVDIAGAPTNNNTLTPIIPNTGSAPYAAQFISTNDGPTDSDVTTTDVIQIDTAGPTYTINDGTATGPVQSDTINITVADNGSVDGTSLEYGFSADNTCDGTDTYGNSFTSGVDFTIAGDHTDYLCVKGSDTAVQTANTSYQLVGQLNTDNTAPSGYTVTIDQGAYINASNETAVGFTFAGAEVGATYNYSFDDTNGATAAITGSSTIGTATDNITGIDVSALDDDTITLSVTLTDPAGNTGSVATDTATKDTVAPSGYTVTIDQGAYINASNETAVGFTFAGAEVGATYNYSFDDTNGVTAAITGSSTIGTATDNITGIDVSALDDDTITLSVTLTDPAGNTGSAATDTATKDTVAPTIISATTADNDSNGQIDTLVVVYNEAVNDPNYDAVAITGYPLLGTGTGSGTTTLDYNITESSTPDTGATPTLTWTAANAADLAGNDLDTTGAPGIPIDGAAPVIITTSPASGATFVSTSANIVVTFSEPMNTVTVTQTSSPDPGGWVVAWDGTNEVATYTHSVFAPLTNYTQTITAGTGADGLALAGSLVPNSWSFQTMSYSSGGGGGGGSTSAPTCSLKINNNAISTDNLDVTLTVSVTGDVSQLLLSNNSNFTAAAWQAYNSTVDWTLDGTETDYGTKTVYAKVKSSSGQMSITCSDEIDYVEPGMADETPAEETEEPTTPPAEETDLVTQDPEPAGPLPSGVSVGTLVKRPDMSTVYFIDQDNRRHAFPDLNTYYSWFSDFSGVQTISSELMSQIPLGSNVVIRPGTYLIKIQSLPHTYAVEPYGVIRWIENQQVAADLYGSDWNQKIVDVDPSFFVNYQVGSAIDTASHPTGSVIQYEGDTSRYYIQDGVKQLILGSVFSNNKLQSKFVIDNVPESMSYESGANMSMLNLETLMTLR